jgi:hypothetical protein
VKAMQAHNAKAVGEAAHELDRAVVVGAPESEGLYVFLNADDRHTLEKAEQVLSDGEDPKSKEISWRPFNTYFLFIFRSRNSCISDLIRSTSSSNAKWPVSRRCSSAPGISLLKSSAPSTVKIPSFLPHMISVGG